MVSGRAEPGSVLEVCAYTRPATTYRVVRSTTVGPDGSWHVEVRPAANTRLYARSTTPGGSADSPSAALAVRSVVQIAVTRVGAGRYRVNGTLMPVRGAVPVTLVRDVGGRVRVLGRTRTNAMGTYELRVTLPAGSTTVRAGAAATSVNAAGSSVRRSFTVR